MSAPMTMPEGSQLEAPTICNVLETTPPLRDSPPTSTLNSNATAVQPTSTPHLVPTIGMDPPLGSQECPTLPTRCPGTLPYTWERTSPVKGRVSGLFVLHTGPTPQSSPMLREAPNVVVNQKQLREALQGKICHRQKGQGGVRRRLEGP